MVARLFRKRRFVSLRERMLRETELALLVGLESPRQVVRIPTIEVGKGSFHPLFAARFWEQALGLEADERASLMHNL